MILYTTISDPVTARRFGLRIETKFGWRSGILMASRTFLHATNTPPTRVKLFGISPEHASEYLVDERGNQLGEGKMVFAMPEGSSGKAVELLWGRLRYTYRFTAPAGTRFYSQGGTIFPNKEVAFPYIIEAEDIISRL